MSRAAPRPPVAPGDVYGGEVRIGVSACILGQEVRWNGGHKLDGFVAGTLGAFVRFVPVCPESEVGMGTPREPVQLVAAPRGPRMLGRESRIDHTAAMQRWAARRLDLLADDDLSGFIVQKGSPSCGMERVAIHREGDRPRAPDRSGRGLFTAALMARFPHLPVEEDGRLHDPGLRESFIERVFAYRRLRALFDRRWTLGQLVAQHAAEKLLVLAHDRKAYDALGRLVATAKGRPPAEVADAYQATMQAGLARIATRGKHANVLQHMAGYFKKTLDDGDRRELGDVIERYRTGLVPLIVPITLFRHHVRRHEVAYLAQQTYLEPHPLELMLRNHV